MGKVVASSISITVLRGNGILLLVLRSGSVKGLFSSLSQVWLLGDARVLEQTGVMHRQRLEKRKD